MRDPAGRPIWAQSPEDHPGPEGRDVHDKRDNPRSDKPG